MPLVRKCQCVTWQLTRSRAVVLSVVFTFQDVVEIKSPSIARGLRIRTGFQRVFLSGEKGIKIITKMPNIGHADPLRLIGLVLNEVKSRRELQKISRNKLRSFSVDLAFVALSVRMGFLVDQFSVRGPCQTFSQLLKSLRQVGRQYGMLFSIAGIQTVDQVAKLFEQVIHIYEPASGQSFFVNTELFASLYIDNDNVSHQSSSSAITAMPARSTTAEPSAKFPSFIELPSGNIGDRFRVLSAPSQELIEALQFIHQNIRSVVHAEQASGSADEYMQSNITLPSLGIVTSVPLAAILLEYPIAYCPVPSEGGSSLARIPLDVYECIVDPPPSSDPVNSSAIDPLTEPYTLLQFSCPCTIAGDSDAETRKNVLDPPQALTSPAEIIRTLEIHFQTRLRAVMLGTSLRVAHTVRTLDSVAL